MKYVCLFCSFLAFAFLSCQKEITDLIDVPIDSIPVILTGDSTLLKEYVEIDTAATAPFDTLTKRTLVYDTLKRLIGARIAYYTNGVSRNEDAFVNVYFYKSTDTLPYKEIEAGIDFGTNAPYSITRFLDYENGKLMKNSSAFASNVLLNKYTYYPGKIIDSLSISDASANYNFKGLHISHLNTANGLLKEQTDTTINNYNIPGVSDTVTSHVEYTYDANPNPFYKFKFLFPFYRVNELPTVFLTEKFNLTLVNANTTTPSGSYNNKFKYRYQYQANGLPAVVWITDQNNPSSHAKGFYYYTK